MKKRTGVLIGIAVVAAVALGAYGFHGVHYRDRFLPKTSVFGVAIGDKTVAQANKAIQKHFDQVTYKLDEKGQEVASVSSSELGLKRNFESQLSGMLSKQNPWGFSAVVMAGTQNDWLSVEDDQKLQSFAQDFVQSANPKRKAPVDAKVVDENNTYVIKKEQAGTQLSASKLATQLRAAVAADNQTVDLTQAYTKPKLTSTSSMLTKAVTKLQKFGSLKATLTIQNHSITVPTQTLHTWFSYTDGQVEVSQTKIRTYLLGINSQYSTYTKSRTFKSTKRGTVTVPAGIYGWSIPTQTEAATVAELVKKGQDFTHALSHVGSGYHEDGTDIGNTYIEVDKVNQHEWYYKDGKLVMDTDVVTGKPSTPTPSGVFAIWAKQRNATLKGEDYSTPVSYWLPINTTGVGLHDASWQPKFGGDWYKKHGSHGCVNNPPAFMAKLYAAVSTGTPVIIF